MVKDRAFSVPELFSWLAAAGLHFTALSGAQEKFRLSLQHLFLTTEVDTHLQSRLARLDRQGGPVEISKCYIMLCLTLTLLILKRFWHLMILDSVGVQSRWRWRSWYRAT